MTDTPQNPIKPTETTPLPSLDAVTQTDLMELVAYLEETLLSGPKNTQSTLMRQSEILNAIFNALISNNLQDAIMAKFYGGTDTAATAGWLGLALQTQKQCTETIKTIGSVNYLDAVTEQMQRKNILQGRGTPSPRK